MASRFNVVFGVAWDRSVSSKSQTLFPVWGEKDNKKATRGVPEVADYTLRATKGVNMHPYPFIRWTNEDGSKYTEEEELKISVVSATSKQPPPVGACACGTNRPQLGESKPYQLYARNGETYCRAKDGELTLSKIQIGCCTGARGHGCSFSIRAEFVRDGSPMKGIVVHSMAIEVGAKGPFAKVFTVNRHASGGKHHAAEALLEAPDTTDADAADAASAPAPAPAAAAAYYSGSTEMRDVLVKLNLEKYIGVFLQNEIDLQAFSQLKEQDLLNMGISKVGPRVKILREIQKWNEQNPRRDDAPEMGHSFGASPPAVQSAQTTTQQQQQPAQQRQPQQSRKDFEARMQAIQKVAAHQRANVKVRPGSPLAFAFASPSPADDGVAQSINTLQALQDEVNLWGSSGLPLGMTIEQMAASLEAASSPGSAEAALYGGGKHQQTQQHMHVQLPTQASNAAKAAFESKRKIGYEKTGFEQQWGLSGGATAASSSVKSGFEQQWGQASGLVPPTSSPPADKPKEANQAPAKRRRLFSDALGLIHDLDDWPADAAPPAGLFEIGDAPDWFFRPWQ